MAIVISDAGPLIALAKTDALFILEKTFHHVYMPNAVWHEVQQKPGEDSIRINQAVNQGWLEVVSVTQSQTIPSSNSLNVLAY